MKFLSVLGAFFLCAIASPAVSAAERPNILFIMADDQAPWALRASGYPHAHTPNLDRVARQGMRFTHALTPTPVCSPSRASLMTSRYGSELGITDWLHPKTDAGIGLEQRHLTWPRLLSEAGYDTALIGKWHLGDLPEQHPTRRGYGFFTGLIGGGTAPLNPTYEKEGVSEKRDGYVVELFAQEAVDWLRARKGAKPFAMSVHFREPHAAYLPVPEQDWEKLKDAQLTLPEPDYPGLDTQRALKMTREYLASVAALDRNIGRILDALDELNLSKNTLVVLTSDHGYNMGHHGMFHKGNGHWLLQKTALPQGTENVPSGQRPNMFDTSLHVPMIVRWPGVVEAGAVNAHTISHLDWLPTFASVAGATLPDNTPVRGRNIEPLLRGKSVAWDDSFYAEYSTKHQSRTHMRALRTPQWKLICDFLNEGRDELYHLEVDPDEKTNCLLAPTKEAREACNTLLAGILSKMELLGDPALESARTIAQKRFGVTRP
jgi:uncharacterized sulfatase